MKWQEFLKDYLTFTRKERIGIIVIISLIIIIFLLPKIVSPFSSSASFKTDTTWISKLKHLELKKEKKETPSDDNSDEYYSYQYDRNKVNNVKGDLFYFDPNTLSSEGWIKLGLKEKTIQIIKNYLAKGGSFRKPEDLQKIYGIRISQYERFAPYIRIESSGNTKPYPINPQSTSSNENAYTKSAYSRYSVIDINSSDTTAFITLPGIGSKLAARIVNFREKLGGFYSIDQVGETYGVPDSTFQSIKKYLKLEEINLIKININAATVDELKAHPYIKWSIANPIVAYRNEHGPFSKLEDIKKIMAVTEDVYNKIAPYLSLQ